MCHAKRRVKNRVGGLSPFAPRTDARSRSERRRCPSRHRKRSTAGFSLLEIILSLTILGGAMAVLGEAVRSGMHNARIARDITDAQLYCESKMAELEAGLLSITAVSDMPIEPMVDSTLESSAVTETEWVYSVETEVVDDSGLVLVYLTVSQDPDYVETPVSFTLTRMMIDETMLATDSSSTDTSGETY